MTDEQRLQLITEQLIIVRDNLFRGLSKSMQKLQAQSINEVLELPNYTQSAKQEQGEPVAWVIWFCGGPVGFFEKEADAIEEFERRNLNYPEESRKLLPLYTTPQQRTWVGLTDEDDIDWEEGGNLKDLVKAIEAKLKEKNNA
jgi:hypothetical protein